MEPTCKPTFYVTTPIYYVNDRLHIGHAYTTVIADALARYNRQAGREVFFLTGTDEHGQKIERAAAARGLTPKALADEVVHGITDLWAAMNVRYDRFIRTTDPDHERGVQELFARLLKTGDIYKGTYRGWYCVSDEAFLAEDVPLDAAGGKTCPDCGKACSEVEEETYFFRLSAYQLPLLEFYAAHPDFVRPASRMNEVVRFVEQGLKDLSVTRTTVRWGIPVPGDPRHTIYVWFDALHNYLTGAGYGSDPERFRKFWPADCHLMAKDILRFHAVFWPAFLMAGGFELPRTVFAHGWWLRDDAKMSKSRGNVLDPKPILDTFGPDPLRYFLLREIPMGNDGNFSHEAFLHRVNSDLANDLGNLVQRTLTMIGSYFGGTLAPADPEDDRDRALREDFEGLKDRVGALYEEYSINRALEEVWTFIGAVNRYLADNAPWKMAADPAKRGRLARVLLQTAAAIRGVTWLLYPIMPASMEAVWGFLAEDAKPGDVRPDRFRFEDLAPGRRVREPKALFPRVALKDFLGEPEAPKAAPAAFPVPPPAAAPAPARAEEKKTVDIVSYEEFAKMDLRVARIVAAEPVPKATKILKLTVDVGEPQPRTMVAGIAETYKPEDLVGKSMIVIANLKPAVIRGIESQAMLLAAVNVDNTAVVPFFDRDLPPGTKVK